MGHQYFYAKEPHRLFRADLRAAHGQTAENGTPNILNCCTIFIVHT